MKKGLAPVVVLVIASLISPQTFALSVTDDTSATAGLAASVEALSEEFSNTLSNKELLDEYVPGEIIVKFKENRVDLKRAAGITKARQFASRQDLSVKENLRRVNVSVFETDEKENIEEVIDRLESDPDVQYAEPNYTRSLAASGGGAGGGSGVRISIDDPSFALQWALENTGQEVDGTSGTNDADIDGKETLELNISTGAGVVVAVIDTGVAYNHPDLAENMWDGTNCVDENGVPLGDCIHGYDFEDDDKNPLPIQGTHGTNVAGIVAAVLNNNTGIVGVAPEAKIMALKFGLDVASEVRAIDFAIQNGASVINASFEGGEYSQAEYDAIARFRDAGGIFIAAAGNEGSDNDTTHYYPADYDLDNIISVAATDQNDALADFSNYGDETVDIGAPGVNVYSTTASVTESTVLEEYFNDVTPPALPSGWTNTGNWGTVALAEDVQVLFADLDTFPYANNANSYATTPSLNLTNSSPVVIVGTICDAEYSESWTDYMELQFSADGVNFEPIARWDEMALDILNGENPLSDESFAAAAFFMFLPHTGTENSKLRFNWVTDGSDNEYLGCLVTSVAVVKTTLSDGSENGYEYNDGTSFAAPHVSGMAAQIVALRPDLSISDVKNTILSNGDNVASLNGKTVSGKRLNVFAALEEINQGTLIVEKVIVNDDEGEAAPDAFSFQVNEGDEEQFEADGHNELTVSAGAYTIEEVETDGYTASYENCSNVTIEAGETATCIITNDDTEPVIPDTTPPVIELSGDNPLNLAVGAEFSEPGFTATDDRDGDISASVVFGGDFVNTETPGTYTKTYNVSDVAGNPAEEKVRSITVSDEDGPVFEGVPENFSVEATSSEGATVTYELPTATDNVDAEVAVSCTPESGAVLSIGEHAVECSATDAAGNQTNASFIVTVEDTTGPVISGVPEDQIIEITEGDGTTATYETPTANDAVDGVVEVTCSPSSGATFGVGVTTVECAAEDLSENETSPTFTITVNFIDTVPPVMTLLGDPTMNVVFGDLFIDPGATAEDNVDGDLTPEIEVSGDINTSESGTYTITYSVEDAAGNDASLTRTVIVGEFVDTSAPVITLTGSSTLNIPTGTDFTDPGATATDNVDGDVSADIEVTGSVATTTPGAYTLTYTVTDEAGNTANATRTVNVSDLELGEEQDAEPTSNSVTIEWTTSHPATSRVLWDTESHSTADALAAGPANYDYAHSTDEDSDLVTEHSVIVNGLAPSTEYFFRPVSHGSPETLGEEVSVTTIAQSTPAPAQTSSGGGGGGGGCGGGGGVSFALYINNGVAETTSQNVTLTIVPPLGVNQMQVSNTRDFNNLPWAPFLGSYPWTLTPGFGTKTVYVRFGNNGSPITDVTDSITFVGPGGSIGQGQVLGASVYNFTRLLQLGSKGADVTELQKILIAGGYLKVDAPTGYFGTMSVEAVKAYQAANGLEQAGIVGPKTRAILNKGGASGTGTPAMGDAERLKLIQELMAMVAKLQAELDALKKQQ